MGDETKPDQLTLEELEAFTLRCVACTAPVPQGRATRRKDTCSVECYNKLKQWRRWLQSLRKCNSCLRPCTPKQRAEFKLWQQQTQGLRAKRGNPTSLPRKPKKQEVVDTAEPESNSIAADHATI